MWQVPPKTGCFACRNTKSVLSNHQVFDYIDNRHEFVVSKVQGLVLLVQKPCTFET